MSPEKPTPSTQEAIDRFRINDNLEIQDDLLGSSYKARIYRWWVDEMANEEGVYIFFADDRRAITCLNVGPLEGPWPRDRVIAAADWLLSQWGAKRIIDDRELPEAVLAWRYGDRLDEVRKSWEGAEKSNR